MPRENEERHDSRERTVYGIYVFVPCNGTDNGTRPLGTGTNVYFSPYITYTPSDSLGRVSPGQPVLVFVQLKNAGNQPAQFVSVEFSYTAPTLAAGLERRQIGTVDQIGVQGKSFKTVKCPEHWTPALENGLHQCLWVRCQVPGQLNPKDATYPYSPLENPWAGIHNVTILDPGAVGNAHAVLFHLPNSFSERRRMRVHIATSFVQLEQDMLAELSPAAIADLLGLLTAPRQPRLSEGLLERVSVERPDRADMGVRVIELGQIDAKIEPMRQDFAGYERDRLAADPDFFGDAFGTLLGDVDLPGHSCGTLSLVFERPNGTDDRFVVHRLVQATGEIDLGGYLVIWPPI